MARRIGKAWGNALGGYKTQNRIGGRFASGFSGSSKKVTKVKTPSGRSTPAQRRAQYLEGKRKEAQKARRKSNVKKAATAAAVVGVVGGAAYAAHRTGALKVSGSREGFGAVAKVRGKSAAISVDRSTKGVSSVEGYAGKRSFQKNFGKGVTAQPIPATKVKGRSRIDDVVKGAGGAATVAASVSTVQRSLRDMQSPRQTDQHGVGKRYDYSPSVIARSPSVAEASRHYLEPKSSPVLDPSPTTGRIYDANGDEISLDQAVRNVAQSKTTLDPINWAQTKPEGSGYDGANGDALEGRGLEGRRKKAFWSDVNEMSAGSGNVARKSSTGQRVSLGASDVRGGSPQARRHSGRELSGIVEFEPDTRVMQVDVSRLGKNQELIDRAMQFNAMEYTPEEFRQDIETKRMIRRREAAARRQRAAQNPARAAKYQSRYEKKPQATYKGYDSKEAYEFWTARADQQNAVRAARDASRKAGQYAYGGIVPAGPLTPRSKISQDAVNMWEGILADSGDGLIRDRTGRSSVELAGEMNVVPYGHGEEDLHKVMRMGR